MSLITPGIIGAKLQHNCLCATRLAAMVLLLSATAQSGAWADKLEWSQFNGSTYKAPGSGTSAFSSSPSVSSGSGSGSTTEAGGNTFPSSGSGFPSSVGGPSPSSGGSSFPTSPANNFPSSFGSSSSSSSGAGFPGGNGIPPAVQRLLGPGHHLQSAAPNPATMPFQGGESAQEAEHQRVLSNMRAHGYSEDRIKSLQPYIHQEDAPGTTYRNVMGIKVRNDGMTFGEAFNNVKTNGLMNTPIETDQHAYVSGTYGYYRTHGGTKNFSQWMDGQR